MQSPSEPRHLQGAFAEFDKNACSVLTALKKLKLIRIH